MITCQIAILVHFKLFELALLVQIRTNTLHQNCVCEENQSRASELLQTLFCTKNGPNAYKPKSEKGCDRDSLATTKPINYGGNMKCSKKYVKDDFVFTLQIHIIFYEFDCRSRISITTFFRFGFVASRLILSRFLFERFYTTGSYKHVHK